MPYFLIPVLILGGLLVLFGLLVFLGRFRGGKLLKPIITTLAKVPIMRRLFQKLSTAALERQNPELVSVMKKLERAGAANDPQRIQQTINQLSPSERRAFQEYREMAEEQGAVPEAPNRQLRRLQQRQSGQPRATPARPGKTKKRR